MKCFDFEVIGISKYKKDVAKIEMERDAKMQEGGTSSLYLYRPISEINDFMLGDIWRLAKQ